MKRIILTFAGMTILVLLMLLQGCSEPSNCFEIDSSAYNSLAGQTEGDPNLTAWGEKLVAGDKAIAVSRDLIKKGLVHGVKVKIDGLSGTYRVADKMNARWKNKIDIFMGTDLKKAKEWGRRKVKICVYD